MKKGEGWLIAVIGVVSGFIGYGIGKLTDQKKINALREQIAVLQDGLSSLQYQMMDYQRQFDNLYLQYKGLKLLQLHKKAEYEGALRSNLVLQYGMKDYLSLLIDAITGQKKLTKEETNFLKAFDDVIEGKRVTAGTFSQIKDHITSKYNREIKLLIQCDCTPEFRRIYEYDQF